MTVKEGYYKKPLKGSCHPDPGSLVGGGSRKFDSRLCQYSFPGLIIDTATGFIPISPLSIIFTMVMRESSQWLGKNIQPSTG